MPEPQPGNHKLTVGFIHVGGDFGEKLTGATPADAVSCSSLKIVWRISWAMEGRRTVAMDAIGDIEIGFIQ